MASSSSKSMVVVGKPSQEPVRCPRCDSSNTKFCYYNNYSLSQPRHFCKACKRYWTRGGTLRNVPVGGGCRKNKRVKRPPPSNGGGVVYKAVQKGAKVAAGNPSFLQPRVNLYSLPTANNVNPTLDDFRYPFSGLTPTKVSSDDNHGGAGLLSDLQPPQVMSSDNLGLGFSTSTTSKIFEINGEFSSSPSSPFINPLFGSSSSLSTVFANSSSITPMAASLFGQTINHYDNYANRGEGDTKDVERINSFQGLMQYYHEDNGAPKNSNPFQDSQMNSSDDPNSSLLWNTSNISSASWFDPSNNAGSSVPSLI